MRRRGGAGNNPKSLAPEYEACIRDIDEQHGHDPGLIFARDLTRQVEKFHGKGGELAKQFVTRLSDRPDLQREHLGGEVPKAPPIGTFKGGTGDGAKAWIGQDRIANGFKPKYAKAVAARTQEEAPVQRLSAQPTTTPSEPDPKNLLEYVQNFGAPEPELPQHAAEQEPAPVAEDRSPAYDDLSDTAKAIASGMGQTRSEPGVQIAMAPPEMTTREGARLEGGYVPYPNRPLGPWNEVSEAPEPRGSRQKGPVAPVPEHREQVFRSPAMRERWEVFNRALDGLPNAGSNERVIYREMYANEGGDTVNPRNFSSSGITETALRDIWQRRLMPPGLEEHANPFSIPTDRRPEVMRAYFDAALRNAGGHGALNAIDDERAARALASTIYFQGEGGGAEAIHNAIRRVSAASPPEQRVEFRGTPTLSRDSVDIYNRITSDPARRDALLNALADERIAVHMRRFNNGRELGRGDRAIIDRYRP